MDFTIVGLEVHFVFSWQFELHPVGLIGLVVDSGDFVGLDSELGFP